MTAFRLISLPTHAVVELLLGLALIASPFALGFGPGGLVSAVALGSLIIGLALGAADTLRLSAHVAADYAIVGALLSGSLALSVVGDDLAALVFLACGVVELALALTTRYSRAPLAH